MSTGTLKRLAALEDARFVRQLTRLDVSAFEQLYDEISPDVYGHLLQTAPSSDLAESMLVETFYRAWGNIHAFSGERAALRPWLIGIASDLLQQEMSMLTLTENRAA